MREKKKVLVAMSGGVDSSVAAALLVKAGHQVVGAFMVNYDEKGETPGCWRGDYQDALRVAAKLGIKLLRLDFTKEYRQQVLTYMYREYAAGRTPNPDVLCNKFIKFGAWLKKAKALGFDKLATGHYAVIKTLKHKNIKTVRLFEARDENKDQTYFLHQLTQAQLKQVLFPIGGYTKPQVRVLAKKLGLPTAGKEESMGICFIGEVPMKKFLSKKIKAKKGKIILSSGRVVGAHSGLAFYTIGERVGIKFPISNFQFPMFRPLYVVAKNTQKNALIVGHENDPLLFAREILVKNINWVAGQAPKFPLKCEVRLRHRQPLQKARIIKTLKHKNIKTIRVFFDKPQRAVTPGQFAVLYLNGECLGGGEIA